MTEKVEKEAAEALEREAAEAVERGRPKRGKPEAQPNEPQADKLDADAIEQAVTGEHIPADEPQPEKTEPDIPAAQLWAMLWQTGCGILAGRRGDHWQLSKDEAKALGEATEPVAEKWLPDFEKGPEAALIITAAMVMSPRIAVDAQNRAKAQAAAHDGKGPG